MEHELRDENLPAIASNALIDIAEQAERRVEAIIKIKKVALKVTNKFDWTNQQDRPYLQVSGSEKIANLFNISWRIDEPRLEFEDDGHFTYTFKGEFSLGGRTIEVEGSRSSKDPFFKKYDWKDGTKMEKPISAIDKRDVKMAALTNLLGNGISRILGIRNLQWSDLEEFAGIKKDDVQGIEYKKGGEKPPITMPQEKKTEGEQPKEKLESIISLVDKVTQTEGKKKDGKEWVKYAVHIGDKKYSSFSKTIATDAKQAAQAGVQVSIEYQNTTYGPEIISLTIQEPPEPGSEG